jgi:hypothetical protein
MVPLNSAGFTFPVFGFLFSIPSPFRSAYARVREESSSAIAGHPRCCRRTLPAHVAVG